MVGISELVGLSWPGGSPENTGLIIAVVVGAYFAALWLSAVVWTGRDIRQRSDDPFTQLVAVLIVLAFNFPGWVLYRVLRPTNTLEERYERELEEETLLHDLRSVLACPRCGGRVDDDYLACPRCATQLRRPCAGCERALEAGWIACPWCALTVEPPAANGAGRFPEPALEPAAAPPPPPESSPAPTARPG